MTSRRLSKLLIFAFTLLTLQGFCAESVHRPPILTTTAIIEIYENDCFQGIVLIERGKAPFGKAIP